MSKTRRYVDLTFALGYYGLSSSQRQNQQPLPKAVSAQSNGSWKLDKTRRQWRYMSPHFQTAGYSIVPAPAITLRTRTDCSKQESLTRTTAQSQTCPCLKIFFVPGRRRSQTATSCLPAERCAMTLRQITATASGMGSAQRMNLTGPLARSHGSRR